MNFFEEQRVKLGLSQRGMAMRLRISNTTIGNWEEDAVMPGLPVALLAKEYEVGEDVMERELMALRRRIEARESAKAAAAS